MWREPGERLTFFLAVHHAPSDFNHFDENSCQTHNEPNRRSRGGGKSNACHGDNCYDNEDEVDDVARLAVFPLGFFSGGQHEFFLGGVKCFLRKEKGLERNKRLSVKLFQHFNDFVGVWNNASESAVVFHRHSSFHGIANVIDHLSGIDFYNQDSFQFF